MFRLSHGRIHFVNNARLARKHIAMVIGVLVILLKSSQSHAALEILSLERRVSAFGTSFCPGCGDNGEDVIFSNGDEFVTSDWGVVMESIFSVGSEAGQNSTVDPTGVSGGGGVGVGSTGDNNADSFLEMAFRVDQTGLISLSGEVFVSNNDFDITSFVAIEDSNGSLFLAETFHTSLNTTFDETLMLQAGVDYMLRASSSGLDFEGTGSVGHWSLNMTPEPASALLLMIGVAAMRRRR